MGFKFVLNLLSVFISPLQIWNLRGPYLDCSPSDLCRWGLLHMCGGEHGWEVWSISYAHCTWLVRRPPSLLHTSYSLPSMNLSCLVTCFYSFQIIAIAPCSCCCYISCLLQSPILNTKQFVYSVSSHSVQTEESMQSKCLRDHRKCIHLVQVVLPQWHPLVFKSVTGNKQ